MQIRLTLFFILLTVGNLCSAATILPVGPITFSTNDDFDKNFKEQGSFNALMRNAAGYLTLLTSGSGLAIYDTSATGGINGQGGTGGLDANNDLSDFVISADFAGTNIDGGFFMRLSNAEGAGYHTRVVGVSPTSVGFELWKNSSISTAGGRIFTTLVTLTNITLDANTFYPFTVTATGGKFDFDFANGAGKASFTDPTLLSSVGQVGIIMTANVGTQNLRADNFQIRAIPEPSFILVAMTVGALCFVRRKKQVRFANN